MKELSFYFNHLLIVAFIHSSHNYLSKCNIQYATNIYALCSGSYTLDNATSACNLNGYVLVADNQSVHSIINSLYYKLVNLID
jgi:hypothetical protein